MKRILLTTAVSLLLGAAATASAQVLYFEVPLDGAQEFPGPGDPDGSGLARLWFDTVATAVTWDITVANIALPITADHIHIASAGASGPVRIDFMSSLQGGPVVDPDVASVLANPSSYYVNVHNADYPAGAVRGQLPDEPTLVIPEPTGWLAMAGVGLAAVLLRRGPRISS